ncbi:MAG TPA: carboxypeptidase-like regulatory domain-containing protein, partial [Bryobacteraceae bacterium]|nr:carboxypeptidase-like regulatory domain-containing protein [Bryobacteraceae bacterium]
MLFRRSLCLLLLALCGFAATSLRADVTGSILGVVHDATQAVVAGVKIVATNAETNLSRETASSADGSYRLLALPAGTYKVTATASGFQQYTTTDIDVKVNDQLKIDITLAVGSVQQEVNVTANSVQVE